MSGNVYYKQYDSSRMSSRTLDSRSSTNKTYILKLLIFVILEQSFVFISCLIYVVVYLAISLQFTIISAYLKTFKLSQ